MLELGDPVDSTKLDAALARFGLSAFRPGQREVVQTLLTGRDVLCVMPTGGGKSLCYQLPSLLLSGLTVVVSPLIALMKDQEDQLRRLGMRVAAIHSGLDLAEQRSRLERIEQGEVDLCYIAPERFRSRRFMEILGQRGVAVLAVDEAHCVSEWGHDFRPDYSRLGWFRQQLDWPVTIALTATATDIVRRDIIEQLQLRDPQVFMRGFDRPNLYYSVQRTRTKSEKLAALTKLDAKLPGSKIVYTSSRKACEEVSQAMRAGQGTRVVMYHAGLGPNERRSAQDAFMSGQADVIVATNAFGMGVDKPDVRAVVHYNLPGTLEAYYQEAGRAGRDGKPARCELLYSPSDRHIQEFFIDGEYPPRALLMKVVALLRSQPDDLIELTRTEMKERLGGNASEMAIGACLKILESTGVCERLRARENMGILRIHETGPDLTDLLPAAAKSQIRVLRHLDRMVGSRRGEDVYFHPSMVADELEMDRSAFNHVVRELTTRLNLEFIPPFRGSATRLLDRTTPENQLPIDFASLAEQKERELAKLEQMVAYAEGCSCRRASILAYFGEETSACGRCDGCDVSQSGELVLVEPGSGVESAVRRSLEAARDTRGRVGKTTLAAALAGSQSQKTQRLGKNHAWMGALSGVPQKHIVDLLHGLQSAGLVRQEGDSMRPTVTISAAGEEFLRGRSQEGLSLRIGGECVASFGRVGEKSARGVERESTPSREDGVAAKDANWTARVLSAGFSIEECSQIRRLSSGQVLDQVLWLVEQGHEVPAGPLLDTSLTGREEVLRRQILRRLEAREAGLSVEGLGRQKENPGAC